MRQVAISGHLSLSVAPPVLESPFVLPDHLLALRHSILHGLEAVLGQANVGASAAAATATAAGAGEQRRFFLSGLL